MSTCNRLDLQLLKDLNRLCPKISLITGRLWAPVPCSIYVYIDLLITRMLRGYLHNRIDLARPWDAELEGPEPGGQCGQVRGGDKDLWGGRENQGFWWRSGREGGGQRGKGWKGGGNKDLEH